MRYRESALFLSIAALLSGCAGLETDIYEPPKAEPVAPLMAEDLLLDSGQAEAPVKVGDVFIYDNPTARWEVVSTGNGFIGWRNQAGEERQTSYSTIFPPLSWIGEVRSGRRSIELVSGPLHPLETGKTVKFITDTLHVRPPGTDRSRWECTVQDKAEIVVKAGKAEVFNVLCYRNGLQYVQFAYAPSLGTYVRAVLANGAQPLIRELTGYARAPAKPKNDLAKRTIPNSPAPKTPLKPTSGG
ncbi:hypothetical protein NUH88_07160 [Nisaea acidiphila]|uniref:Uncharacterized protein n=1 Tax=Nisaea acidiphila TaxID=1862145 RepID=A0A9J7AXE8_9PROT|nr:hypothetical protein [Nisaea acidiphila]UUX51466.1 hypothetical protein NUH88_07160 [Nisaea acidiphila]